MAVSPAPFRVSTRSRALLPVGCLVLATYLFIVMLSTRTTFLGDTPDYVDEIAVTLSGIADFKLVIDSTGTSIRLWPSNRHNGVGVDEHLQYFV